MMGCGRGAKRLILFVAFSAMLLLGVNHPARAGQAPDPEKYVPRAEYEELKKQFQDVLKRLEALEKAKASSPTGVAGKTEPTTEAEPVQVSQGDTPPAVTEKPSSLKEAVDSLIPGYEVAKQRRMADPTVPPPMSVRVAELSDMQLYMGFAAVGRLQYLTQDDVYIDGARPDSLQAGFQTPFANMSFMATFDDVMDVYFDFYISTRAHPDYMQGGQGYLLFKKLPQQLQGVEAFDWFFENFDIRAGGFEVDYGDAHYRRSNAGSTWQNPLIGNYVVDPRGIDIGVEIIANGWPFKALVGMGSGTYKGHFGDGSGYSSHAKFWGDPLPGLRTSLSLYHADHSGDGPGWPENNGTAGDLFVTNRSGGPYGGVFGGGDAPGQLLPGAGQQVSAAQLDLTWRGGPVELYGYFGWMTDEDTNGSAPGNPREGWYYYAAEGIYNFTDRLYMAGRYSGAKAIDINDASSDGYINRFALGGGYWLFDVVLLKVEFVYQGLYDFDEKDGKVCGVDAWQEPSFYGAITEASFGF